MPFENTPDTDFFFESEKHTEGFSRLSYVVSEKKSCGVITGAFGTGKTLILNYIERQFKRKGYVFSTITNPRLDDLGLLKIILYNFTGYNIPKQKEDVIMGLHKFLRETSQDGKHAVAVIDEAHLIEDSNVFEELRLLLNFQTESKFLITLLLSGQTELKNKIDSNKQFNQRVVLNFDLEPLDFEETKNYILHRLKIAGIEENIFDDNAINLIYQRSGGIPRRINSISDMCLLTSFSKNTRQVNPDIVNEAVESVK